MKKEEYNYLFPKVHTRNFHSCGVQIKNTTDPNIIELYWFSHTAGSLFVQKSTGEIKYGKYALYSPVHGYYDSDLHFYTIHKPKIDKIEITNKAHEVVWCLDFKKIIQNPELDFDFDHFITSNQLYIGYGFDTYFNTYRN